MKWKKKHPNILQILFSGLGTALFLLIINRFLMNTNEDKPTNHIESITTTDNSSVYIAETINIDTEKGNDKYVETMNFRATQVIEDATIRDEEKEDFITLHEKNITAIRNNNHLLSHDIVNKIYGLPSGDKIRIRYYAPIRTRTPEIHPLQIHKQD